MATPPGVTIYNLPPAPPRWDKLGVFFIAFASVWTFIVAAGMLFLLYHRKVPLLRVRCLPLFFGSITLLHLYWILAQCVYPLGGAMPVQSAFDAQYFVMGIMFPLGIGLYHAANLRFLHVAELQKQFLRPSAKRRRNRSRPRANPQTWMGRFRALEYTNRNMVIIGVAMIFQIILCVVMWLVCEKYHPGFGVKGTEISGSTIPEQLIDLGRGWEWWPSVLWQAIWTWIVAPILIWRAWDIRDTLGWRTQTICACLAGLHAVPMFLIASYVPAFTTVNMYFPPSQWIHLTTFFLEIITIFVPLFQLLRQWTLHERVAQKLARWSNHSDSTAITTMSTNESRYSTDSYKEKLPRSASRSSSTISITSPTNYFRGFSDEVVLNMSSLERILDEHPLLLQTFSASRDFSGENIAFLIRVAQWKTSFLLAKFSPATTLMDNPARRAALFASALDIYVDLVSPRDADFPLNLLGRDIRKLERMFEDAARALRGAAPLDIILPFESQEAEGPRGSDWSLVCEGMPGSPATPGPALPLTEVSTSKEATANTEISKHKTTTAIVTKTTSLPSHSSKFSASSLTVRPTISTASTAAADTADRITSISPTSPTKTPALQTAFISAPSSPVDSRKSSYSVEPYTGVVPEDFDETVFDAATSSIKYLVLTNTWPKFVDEMKSGNVKRESGSSTGSSGQMDSMGEHRI